MKPLLALATLALTALVFEEKARQIARDAQDAYDGLVKQGCEAQSALTAKIERQPLMSLLVAGGVAYALATLIPTRN